MNFLRVLLAGGLAAALPLWAVYAPVPEQEQGKALTLSLKAGVSYDSNIFGGAAGAISSRVFEVAPKVDWNASVTDQTFMSLSYEPTVDYFTNRPTEKTLDSHMFMARVAHAFSPSTTIDVIEMLQSQRNPESLLNGLPLNADQSSVHNEVNATFVTSVTAKIGASVKARTAYTHFRNAMLGRMLDRYENLVGLSCDYAVRADLKAAAEFRHQDVFYDKLGEAKNKRSDFLMGGLDYSVAQKVKLGSRAGLEWRHRAAERSAVSPFVELTAKYEYTAQSFITGGYMLTMEEGSDVVRFNDTRVNRFLASVQHYATPFLVCSGSVIYEPSVLRGRRGQANLDEETLRTGLGLNYLPTKNWTATLSYDYDHTVSDDPARSVDRHRVGLQARYTF